MASFGPGAFLSGFERGLMPGLQGGVNSITGGWQREDEWNRQSAAALAARKHAEALHRKKLEHESANAQADRVSREAAAEKSAAARRYAAEKGLEGAQYRANTGLEGTKYSADKSAGARLGVKSMDIGETRRQEATTSYQERMAKLKEATKAYAESLDGPPDPAALKALYDEHMGGMTPMESKAVEAGQVTEFGRQKPKGNMRPTEDLVMLENLKNTNKQASGAQSNLVRAGPGLKHTNPALYQKLMQQSGATQQIPGQMLQSVDEEFRRARGRPPESPQELRDFARGE